MSANHEIIHELLREIEDLDYELRLMIARGEHDTHSTEFDALLEIRYAKRQMAERMAERMLAHA